MHALPDDYNRVVLEEIPGVQGSDYINASFIDVIISCTALCLVTVVIFCIFYRDTGRRRYTLQLRVSGG